MAWCRESQRAMSNPWVALMSRRVVLTSFISLLVLLMYVCCWATPRDVSVSVRMVSMLCNLSSRLVSGCIMTNVGLIFFISRMWCGVRIS